MKQKGFTLIEVLLSVTIISLLAGISIPVYESFNRQNDLELATQNAANMLRRAESYARSGKHNSVWGIKIQSSNVILYSGTNFASRNPNYDEIIFIPSSITLSGLDEVQFTKIKALPNTSGVINLTSTNNSTKAVTINAKGMVDY